MLLSQERGFSVSVAVYNNSSHVVIVSEEGDEHIQLPDSVIDSSIFALDSDQSPVSFELVKKSDSPSTFPGKLTASVTKKGETITGKIMSMDPQSITLETGEQVVIINNYEKISIQKKDQLDESYIRIEDYMGPITVSYLMRGLNWRASADLFLLPDDRMFFSLRANVSNGERKHITADVTLIGGRPRESREESSPRYPVAMMAFSKLQDDLGENSYSEDYFKYALGKKLLSHSNHYILDEWESNIIKVYFYRFGGADVVRLGYRFLAGGYISACSANIYLSGESMDYIGSTRIEEHQQDDEVDILLGETSMLQSQSKMGLIEREHDSEAGTTRTITAILESKITNHNNHESILVLKYWVGTSYVVSATRTPNEVNKGGFVEWHITIAPKSKEIFECELVINVPIS